MLDIKFIRENWTTVQQSLDSRKVSVDLEALKSIDENHRNLLQEIETLRNKRNTVSDQIATLKKAGKDATEQVDDMRVVSGKIKQLEKSLTEMAASLKEILLGLPNVPHDSVPIGHDESDNELIRQVGERPPFDYEPKAHWDLGEN